MQTLPVFSSASRSLITLRNAGFGLTVLTCAGLIAAPAHAQVLTLGQSGTTLSGTATITDSGTTTTAGSIYTYDDFGTGRALTDQNYFAYLYAYGSSTANVSGGVFYELDAFDTSTVNVSGGTIYDHIRNLDTYDTSTTNVSGGSIFFLSTYDTSKANVSGGDINLLLTTDNSTANVSGGDITALGTYNNSTINLFGTGFTETFLGDYSDDNYQLYSVAGTLQNGDLLNANYYYDYGGTLEFNGVAAVPVVPVPEASSVVSLGLLLVMGLGGVAVRRKRMWQAIV